MRSTSILAPRNQANRRLLATAAFGHATAVLGDAARAELVAAAALRRGGSSKVTVLAHARHLAISQMRNSPKLSLDDEAELEVREFAQQLAMTRTPLERSIIDLDGRQRLNSSELGSALGVAAPSAQARLKTISKEWADTLDPALMAWLGPGSCEELASLLTRARLWPRHADAPIVGSVDSTGPVPIITDNFDPLDNSKHPSSQSSAALTVRQFVEVAPQVLAHTNDCNVCAARLAGLNGVQEVLLQVPLVEPSRELLRASRPYRQRITTSEPPSIDPKRKKIAQLRGPLVATVLAVMLLGSCVLFWNMSHPNNESSREARINDLVNNANESHLRSTQVTLSTNQPQTTLTNTGQDSLLWHATASAGWLAASPDNGRLESGKSVVITLTENPRQSNGRNATIDITANDESRLVLRYNTNGMPQPLNEARR